MATPTSLPATFVSGDVLTAAQMNNLRGAFRVLQVVSASTSTEVTNSTTTYADTTLTATITPSAISSKILVYVSHPQNQKSNVSADNALNLQLLRGATSIYIFNTLLGFSGSATQQYFSANAIYLDSPATTSATTYKTQLKNFTASAHVRVQAGLVESQIILMEISA
jgi:hypothetical protein